MHSPTACKPSRRLPANYKETSAVRKEENRQQPTDPLSGDNGPNFFGHAWNTATYVVDHAEFGWLAFGGNVHAENNTVEVTPLDSFRMRVYLAPMGLWLTLDAGGSQSSNRQRARRVESGERDCSRSSPSY